MIEAGAGRNSGARQQSTQLHRARPPTATTPLRRLGRVTAAIRPPGSARAAAAGVILVYRTLWVVARRRRLTAAAAPTPVAGFVNPIFITACPYA